MHRHRRPRRRIGVPKGLLRYFSLKLIQREPMSGSEIMESMEEYTDWRPSPGSIYPMLANLQENGLIEPYKNTDPDLKRFQITEKGTTELKEAYRHPDHFGARQKSMRKMYWILHKGMPKDVYDSFSNLLDIVGTTYEKILESEEHKQELKQVLDDAAKAIKELGEQTL